MTFLICELFNPLIHLLVSQQIRPYGGADPSDTCRSYVRRSRQFLVHDFQSVPQKQFYMIAWVLQEKAVVQIAPFGCAHHDTLHRDNFFEGRTEKILTCDHQPIQFLEIDRSLKHQQKPA